MRGSLFIGALLLALGFGLLYIGGTGQSNKLKKGLKR